MSTAGGRVRWVVGAAALVLIGCGGGDDDTTVDDAVDDATSELAISDSGDGSIDAAKLDLDLDDVAGFESTDRRPILLSELGGPDAFVIKVDEVGGEVSRLESWSYYDAATQIDLIDGEVLWEVEVAELPDGSLLPLAFDPLEFTMLAGVDETLDGLAGVELERLEGVGTELEVEGAEIWAGEQLVMAFVDDRLVYVETFPLSPGEQEGA